VIPEVDFEIGRASRPHLWGEFKLGDSIDIYLRAWRRSQEFWAQQPPLGPGYGSPAWSSAEVALFFDAASPYCLGKTMPDEDVFDAFVCAFAAAEDDLRPVFRHFIAAYREWFQDGTSRGRPCVGRG
jgi:hypothetical protein